MVVDVVGIAQTKAFVFHLAEPTPLNGHPGDVTAYPLLATWRLH